ncbi:MAG: type I 3-dehydroquinate dehydratase [Proteobacteria bacterium]|nr:type I 3-dehydroquinate dehydratase [Pseudomonadota bacterium]MBU1709196.1 type I 3-dehydroquinate dehydratase [Pseudomonadota bacterium]
MENFSITGKICVSIAAPTAVKVLELAKSAEDKADVIEIRLDSLEIPEIKAFVTEITKPILFTNRPRWEGGNYQGEEKDRIAQFFKAIEAGAAYIDIELKTSGKYVTELIKAAELGQTKVIISWHDFERTPKSRGLSKILFEQIRRGAHIGKIVTMADDFDDVNRVLDLIDIAKKKQFPLIAFCMGDAGMMSRIATLERGGFMTYAAPDTGGGTATGQMPIAAMREIFK